MEHLNEIYKDIENRSIVNKYFLTITTLLLLFVVVTSCSSISVVSDYDKEVNFETYKSFAFYKTGIDQAEINDLDKRRILRAIETNLLAKGFVKSSNPDLLVSMFTKSREQINVWNNGFGPYGYGWGWSPWYYNNMNTSISSSTEGILYIDLIDANKKELIWQGQGTGYLSQNKKDERIQEFVGKIMEKYPPEMKK